MSDRRVFVYVSCEWVNECVFLSVCAPIDGDMPYAFRMHIYHEYHVWIWDATTVLLFRRPANVRIYSRIHWSENGERRTRRIKKNTESTELKWARFIVCRTKYYTHTHTHAVERHIHIVPAIGSFFRVLSRASIYERKHYPQNAQAHTYSWP